MEKQEISKYGEASYLNYSMYVILDRALPHIGDGLKPVQRRIVFSMNDLGLLHTAKYKKAARTVGDVLGKFHPHGDSACYEAMVLMSQNFSYRAPIIDGQGNWGSQDEPKSYAAMRYTEAKLTKYASYMLDDLKHGTTDFQPNFDGTLLEPLVLPVKVPNIIINGTSGIAVGMATDIPSHNLTEVCTGVIAAIDNPSITLEEMMDIIPAPDLATGGVIIASKAEMMKAYETGRGSFKVRARYSVEDGDIVITELPFKSSGEKILQCIGELIQQKKINFIEDTRDESDQQNPTRIVLVLKKNAGLTPDQAMTVLFGCTDLENSQKINLNIIGLNEKPKVKGLLQIIHEWLAFRQEKVVRKLNFRLNKINDRIHIIDGLLTIYLDIDKVIEIVRFAENPKAELMSYFSLSEIQADAILDTKLRNLSKLDENALQKEKSELEKEKSQIETILSSDKNIKKYIKRELEAIIKESGESRRSLIVSEKVDFSIDEAALSPSEPITVVLSSHGWIKAGKGHNVNGESLTYKSGDSYFTHVKTMSNKRLIAFDNTGRSYSLKCDELPNLKGFGDPITKFITTTNGAKVIALMEDKSEGAKLLVSKDGYGFKCLNSEFFSKQTKGKVIMTCDDGLSLPPVEIKSDHLLTCLLTNKNEALIVFTEDFKELVKGKGNKMISLQGDDHVIDVIPLSSVDSLILTIENTPDTMKIEYSKLTNMVQDRAKKAKPIVRLKQKILSIQKG